MPDCGISTDTISGFCGETEEEHQDTVSLMKEVQYDMAYMFKYSERPKTLAERKYEDDVPEEVKARRLDEMIETHKQNVTARTKLYMGYVQKILIEGISKKSANDYYGRNSQSMVVIIPKGEGYTLGDYVDVMTTDCTVMTLIGHVVKAYPRDLAMK